MVSETAHPARRRASVAVGALGALLTLALAGLWLYGVSARETAATERDAAAFRAALASRISDVERTLLGFAGFLGASEAVTPGDFTDYHARVLGPLGDPSWRAVAYMPEIPRASLPALRAALEAAAPDYAAADYPPFARFPEHDRSLAYPVVLVEPPAAREGVFGYDLASSPERMAAVGRARQTGGVAVSEPVRLSQDAEGAPTSLLLVAAVERTASPGFPPGARGVAAAGFTPQPILAALLDAANGPPSRARLTRGAAAFAAEDGAGPDAAGLFARWIAAPPLSVAIGGARFDLAFSEWRGAAFADLAALAAILGLGGAATGFAVAFTRRVETTSETIAAELARRSDALRRAERLAAEDRRVAALGRLVGGVAQDFNNLLTVILGNLDILREAPDHPERDAIATETVEAAERGAALTRQLLSYGGRAALRPAAVSVDDALEQAAAIARRAARAPVEVIRRPAPEPLAARADPNALAGALLDLVVNACDAMPEGGTLTLSAARCAAPPEGVGVPCVAIGVADTGPGVAPENRAAIFEPFFTTKSPGSGAGLGLAAAMGFARQSGGTITVGDASAGGAAFTLYLPLEETPAPAPDTARSRAAGRVLLVEDDALVRHTVRTQLERIGYAVETAPDGGAALDALGAGAPPDLLVTDIVMPGGVSGAALARRLRAERPGLPVLFISGYPRTDLIGDHAIPPDAPLLLKPFRAAELASFLERHAPRGASHA